MSGLKINLEKSQMIQVGKVDTVEDLACEIECKVGKLPSSYLRLPLGASYKFVAAWYGVEERFRKRLSLWKRQHLLKGGWLTLLRSTWPILPIYFMSMFTIPKIARLRLEKIQRDFLWGGGALENKMHLVKWSSICKAKSKGGLGVRSLSLPNKALFCKWSWGFSSESDSLWKKIIKGKFGEEEGGWRLGVVIELYGVGVWKEIGK